MTNEIKVMKSCNNTLLVFPGQGSQAPGMAKGWQGSQAAQAVLEEASDALKLNLAALMAEDADAPTLTLTQNAQPCLLVVGLMANAALAEATGKPLKDIAYAVAGHSLGEYTAVAAAGGFGVTEAAKLVRVRGEAMAKSPAGGMSAVLNMEVEAIEKVLEAYPTVLLANDNANGQAVIAGPLEDLPAAEEALKGAGAKRVLRLPVGGAFHTPMQTGAAEAMKKALQSYQGGNLKLPCLMNFTAQYHDKKEEVIQNLIAQTTGRVRWREGMIRAAEGGITQVIELGCGKVLSGLAPRCDSRLSAQSLTTTDDLLRWVEGQG